MSDLSFFPIPRLKEAIKHLENFDSNWVLVPLLLAIHGVSETTEVLIKPGDRFFDQYFHGSLIGLEPFENGANSLRPRFSDFYKNMVAQGKQDDYVYHQATKLWANVYSSRGYREMRTAGLLSGERSNFQLTPTFVTEWPKRLSEEFRFEELLIWLYAFTGFPSTTATWSALMADFENRDVLSGQIPMEYKARFEPSGSTAWPSGLLESRPDNSEFREALIPSYNSAPPIHTILSASEREEEIEGVDDSVEQGVASYPINDVLIRTESKTAYEVVRRMNDNRFILDPDFQRDFIWPTDKQSKLIESALMRIPLPVFYLAERRDGKVIVVDGLQRLTTFQRFLGGDLVLKGLPEESGLNGKTFHDLPPILQSRVEDTNLILYLIDHKAPDRAKLDIFERVNSGMQLTRQQFRNCVYVGPATHWLKKQSRSEAFVTATRRSLSSTSMRDREAINRFSAFYLFGAEAYRGEMDAFLGRALEQMNGMHSSELMEMEKAFQRSMASNFRVFGATSFRKAASNPINLALFDVFSTLFTELEPADLTTEDVALYKNRFLHLLADADFQASITLSTNAMKHVRTRFAKTQSFFKHA